jgi:phospholipid/cholesterol/gamma-HCH transport system substrate-binding protein
VSTQASNLKVGVFVIAGLILGVGAIAWLGASQYLKGAATYVAFFNESVQGLQNDSTVKYRGVDVGRVKAIRVAPDYRLIEVVMDIEFEGDLSTEIVAQLTSAGITGITFIELDHKKKDEKDLSPRIDFVTEYPIIPSRPSELTRIVSTLDKVMTQIGEIDFKGMGGKVEDTINSVQKLLSDQRLQRAMDHLESASKATDQLTSRLDRLLNDVAVKDLVANSRATMAGLKAMVKETRNAVAAGKKMLDTMTNEIEQMKLPETAAQANHMFRDLNMRSQQVGAQAHQLASEAQTVVRNLAQASATLRNLLRQLEKNPSSIIFSEPPAPRGEHQAGGR